MRLFSGLRAWILQRISAVFFVLFGAYLALTLPWQQATTDWIAWFTPMHRLLVLAAVWLILGHAWVGLRNVLMDYVHAPALRLTLMLGVAAALLVQAFWWAQLMGIAT
jgi:succinate dehydrogenase / fumarate reductase membrane anchor subunit